MCICVCVLVAQPCPTVCNAIDWSLPPSSFHGILQTRIQKWAGTSFSRRSSRTRYQAWVFQIAGRFFFVWDNREAHNNVSIQFSSVQLLSHVWLCATPWIPARQASLSITISRSSLKVTSIKLVMPSSHLILCRPLLLLPPVPPSIRVFSSESTLHMRWPKYRNFSFSIIPSNEHSGLISFRMGLLDLLAVQGTLKSLLQHHSSKASILWCSAFILWRSAFFTVQLSHPYMTTGKTIALTRRTFVGKVMSLLLNMLSRFPSTE